MNKINTQNKSAPKTTRHTGREIGLELRKTHFILGNYNPNFSSQYRNDYLNKNSNITNQNQNFVNPNLIKDQMVLENVTNGGGYLHSEGNVNISYGMNRQNSSGIRGSSISHQNQRANANYADNINKNNLEILHRNLKGVNNNLNTNSNITNNNYNLNILSAKRENYLQQQHHNSIKTERALKSLSPNVKLESVFASEQKKKLLLKNSVKYFSNNNSNIIDSAGNYGNLTPNAHARLGANANNISAINNVNNTDKDKDDNSRIIYEDRVVHTDSAAGALSSRNMNDMGGSNSSAVLSPSTHANRNLAVNSNRAVALSNNNINNINNTSNTNNQNSNNLNNLNNLNTVNSPNTKNNMTSTKDDSRNLKNDSLISNSFLQRRKNK